jgi:membrane-bound lytic murein transglycosylase A
MRQIPLLWLASPFIFCLIFPFSVQASAFWDSLDYAGDYNVERRPLTKAKSYRPRGSQLFSATRASSNHYRPTASCRVSGSAGLPDQCVQRSPLMRQGLMSQIQYLNKKLSGFRKASSFSDINANVLLQTAKTALDWLDGYTSLDRGFELVNISGSGSGKVKFTGYFTPFISARKYPDSEYRHPIYGKPSTGPYPTRAQIFEGVLRGKNLEIAWTNNPVDLYIAQIQGSGVLAFDDGRIAKLHFAANSPAGFMSITKYMKKKGYIKQPSEKAMRDYFARNPGKVESLLAKNPRYVFFKLGEHERVTASGMPVVSGHTAAVDTNYIPFGSLILAEVPISNRKGQLLRHEWRLLFAQDRGGAIKTNMHLDLYTGIGEDARKEASQVTGFGRAYLLVKKGQQRALRTALNKF